MSTSASAEESQISRAPTGPTQPSSEATESKPKRGLSFWLVFFALCVALFLSALDLTAVSTALPTIVGDLHATEFAWIGSAYSIGSTAFLPMSGALAQVFGRRPIMLGALVVFAVGSAVAGAAKDMPTIIVGRAIQGVGGAGILSLTSIIIADLVSLQERGIFGAITGSVWAVASAIGPPIGGALAEKSSWRWLFYMNLPLTGAAFVLVLVFLRLRTPKESFQEKFARLDWFGNFLIVTSSTSVVIALTWGGVSYPWSSFHVLLPLILGIVGMAGWVLYEAKWAKEPTLPLGVIVNRTTMSGYTATFLHSMIVTGVLYYMPAYFQAAKGASPISSGTDLLSLAFTIAIAGMVAGASTGITKKYRPQNVVGWCFILIGLGLFTTIRLQTPKRVSIGLQVVEGVGLGILFPIVMFPVLAPLPLEANAHALAFLAFVRCFAQTWGVTVGSAVLQNELRSRLPEAFTSMFPEGVELAYATIPAIPRLPEPVKTQVQDAFAESVRVVWKVLLGIAAAGFLSSLVMKEIPLHATTDEKWGMEEKKKPAEVRAEEALNERSDGSP